MKTIKRRRREGKTDYKARLKLLESSLPRISVRKTNRYVTAQYIESRGAQDYVTAVASSKELLKYGWKNEGSLKSLPASYFTGILLGKKIKEKNKNTRTILDIGLAKNAKKGRIYAVLKGIADSGINIPHKKEIFPDEKRIRGEHLKHKLNFDQIMEKIK